MPEEGPFAHLEGNAASPWPETSVGETMTDPAAEAGSMLDPKIGLQIGNYHIQSKLGKGGFGTVYLARDVKLHREAALKFLNFPLEPKHAELFRQEAKAIAALGKHPGIVQIYEWGEYQGQHYLALEYVGQSVHELLDRSPAGLDVTQALRIALQCAQTLSFAHAHNILHRDIKPANILIDAKTGDAKVVDFGLACLGEPVSLQGPISGSPPYMSPEQAAGEHVDGRSDIFSLGVALYQMLSGVRPFEGASGQEVMDKIRNNISVPLHERKPNLPENVKQIVARAMAHAPEKRYQTAEEFAGALEQVLDDISVNKRSRLNIRRWHAAVAVIVIAGVLFFFEIGQRNTIAASELVHAKEKINSGDGAAGESLCSAYLSQHPEDDRGWYALGWALLSQNKMEEAGQAFGRIQTPELRTEGELATGKADAHNASVAATPYAKVLLASRCVQEEHNEDALKYLSSVNVGELEYHFQQAEYLLLLGKAHYRCGQYEQALDAFEKLESMQSSNASNYGAILAAMVRENMDAAARERRQSAIANVKSLLDQMPEQPEQIDPWTSRPLTLCILPSQANTSRLAAKSGLADVLPFLVDGALRKATSIQTVDRQLLDEVLQEQTLSAQLSSERGKLQLGKILGARLLVEFQFRSLLDKEYLFATLVDTETTASIPLDRLALEPDMNPEAFAAELAMAISQAITKNYPLQGRVYKTPDGLEVNVGKSVGVSEGMTFAVMAKPNGSPIAGWSLLATAVGPETAQVTPEGFTPESIPDDGFSVQESVHGESTGSDD